jgi:hypothetical protein
LKLLYFSLFPSFFLLDSAFCLFYILTMEKQLLINSTSRRACAGLHKPAFDGEVRGAQGRGRPAHGYILVEAVKSERSACVRNGSAQQEGTR